MLELARRLGYFSVLLSKRYCVGSCRREVIVDPFFQVLVQKLEQSKKSELFLSIILVSAGSQL